MDLEKFDTLVRRIAYCLHKRLPAPMVDVNDLIQAGWIGLLDAAKKFREEEECSFETYAGIRIRGSMLDELRALDWGTRSIRRKMRSVSNARSSIEQSTGTTAKSHQIAKKLNISLEEYFAIVRDGHQEHLPIFEDEMMYSKSANHHDVNLAAFDLHKFLTTKLLPKQQDIFHRYYILGQTLGEIGKHYGFSEGRACQVRTEIDKLIRKYFEGACEWTEQGYRVYELG